MGVLRVQCAVRWRWFVIDSFELSIMGTASIAKGADVSVAT
jgi:hypothetical protein